MNHYFRGVCKHTIFLTTLLCLLSFGVVTLPAAEKTADKKTTETAQKRIDLNKATQAELETLPGVGPATAQNIIAARPFKSVQELKDVSGISEARFKEVQNQVTVSSSSTASRSTPATPSSSQRKTASSAESSSKPSIPPSSASKSARIDLNTADAPTLETLPGVGPSIAQNIIAARPFKSVDDLKEVGGIGEARFHEIQPLVTVATSRASRPASGSPAPTTTGRSPSSSTERSTAQKPAAAHGKININTATQAELESLLSIGPAKAQAIIEGRPYKSIEDVMQVKGIKDGTFEKIQDQITVR